ncbi:BRO-N domain-containing protein [Pseudomonas aeruginosa]|uniref:BRO-N domain-containing protein n=1 Tax=Pseudomonas aeruginosa TaxID=287 RepID=UPI00249C9C33|nr:BRO family protein [Pseudomonas aeruginosa]EIU3787369.1 phage repressor protein [Pseudomonas aeruginosa]EKV0487526.1 phage repressor protein [Pseudomonas aeruginosa]WGX88857.1 BRO family protein [Pseudomonas aeruginosa]
MSSAKVIPFQFEARKVRALLIEDLPWFFAVDVCSALALSDTNKALLGLDSDEKCEHEQYSGSGRKPILINESGLYSLILRSRKTEAKRFKKWVTAEVLPSIRKHGWYEDSDSRMATLVGQTIGTDGFHMLGALIKGKVSSLPAPVQRRATAKIWSQTHAAFGVRSAADIPAGQLDSARNFIAACAIQGEFLGGDAVHGCFLDDGQIYDVYFVCHHFERLYDIFKRHNLYTHLSGLGSSSAVEMIGHFRDGASGVCKIKNALRSDFEGAQARLGMNR